MFGMQAFFRVCPRYRFRSSNVLQQRYYSKQTPVVKSDTKHSKVLYDGECSICQVEISLLKRLPNRQYIDYVDITKLDYKPELYHGITYEQAMKEMHVISNDKVYVKADAIRKMYEVVGLKWLADFSRWPTVAPYCDKLYIKFAKYRLERALKTCDTDKCSIKLKQLKEASEGRDLKSR